MPLSESDRERVRYHLGYLNVGTAASIQLGIPRPLQTLFLVEMAMDNLLTVGVPRVIRILDILDGVECKLTTAQTRLAATALEDLKLNNQECEMLENEYVRWAERLSDTL